MNVNYTLFVILWRHVQDRKGRFRVNVKKAMAEMEKLIAQVIKSPKNIAFLTLSV